MNIGMLWLDDDGRTDLDQKIRRAADYYRDKYGLTPELCLVNSAALEDEKIVDRIRVRPVRNILPNHFWLGMNPS